MNNKHLFVQLKDTLTELREKCYQAVEEKSRFLNDKEGELGELISVAEQMEMLKKLQNDLKQVEKDTLKKQFDTSKNLNDLDKKFNLGK